LNPEELALLNLIKAGNIPAFEKLFNTHYATLCIYARKMVGDLDEARDIVQNIFVALYDKRDALEINTSIKPYLYKSVYHACLNHLKQIKIHNIHHDHLKYQLPFSDDQDTMIKAELEGKIWMIVQSLPEQCRKIFEMNRFEGKKNSEIAEELGISIRTVETQISKALKILRENLIHFLVTLLLFITTA
jgi:RNA polymerase sigma-70 factor (ECF subfamily)